jgi:hypothetical protein
MYYIIYLNKNVTWFTTIMLRCGIERECVGQVRGTAKACDG